MNRPAPLRLLLLGLAAALCSALRAAPSAPDTRAAFLQLLERPRVPLAVEVGLIATSAELLEFEFSYSSEAGQRVPGLLVKPAAPTPARRAAVISLHGTGNDKRGQLKLLRQFAAAGFIAVAIDTRHHGARASSRKDNADYTDAILRAYRDGTSYPFLYDTVWDVSRLLDWLTSREDVDPARLGLIGFSKGGIEAWLCAAADLRLTATVSCLGVQSFAWALEHNAWQPRADTIKAAFSAAARDAGAGQAGLRFAQKFYDRIAPGLADRFDAPRMLPLIAPRPFLAINGDSDPLTPLPGVEICAASARLAYAETGTPERFTLVVQTQTGHKITPASLQLARDWLARWLRP